MSINTTEEMLKKLNNNFTTIRLFGTWSNNKGLPAIQYLTSRQDLSKILSKTIEAGIEGLKNGYYLDYGFCVVLYKPEKDIYIVLANTININRPLPVESVFDIQYISDSIIDILAYIVAVYW